MRSRAFTLIELLVTLGVIGVLAAILLPAIHRSREAGRRIHCRNSLRQISIAVSAYLEQFSVYPTPRLMTGPGWSANSFSQHTYILPQLEQSAVFNAINFSFGRFEGLQTPTVENGTARLSRIESFLCPSESNVEVRNSYRYNLGLFRQTQGPFRLFFPTKASDISDGLHSTAFLSERVGGSFVKGLEDPIRDIKQHAVNLPGVLKEGEAKLLCQTSRRSGWFHTAGRYWFYYGSYNTTYYHDAIPNEREPSCELDLLSREGSGGVSGPRSIHHGGVNLVFGDGHVDFIGDNIDRNIWTAMGTRAAND